MMQYFKFKYFGICVEDRPTFWVHIEDKVKELKGRLGFYYYSRACLNLAARKTLVQPTFLCVLGYGDIIYMNAASSTLRCLDYVYHSFLYATHCCVHITVYLMIWFPGLH